MTPTATAPAPHHTAADLDTVAKDLVQRLGECGPERCDDVLEDPTRTLPRGAATSPRRATSVTILDDYGGVAAFRVSADGEDEDAQIVVIVQMNERWLVRDVMNVADQPSADR